MVFILVAMSILGCERLQKQATPTGLAIEDDGLSSIDQDIQRLEQELKKQKEQPAEKVEEVETPSEPLFSDEGSVKKITVAEGDLINLSITAQDPDGDLLRVVFTQPLSPEGVWQTQIGDEGTYKATATVSDGENTVVQEIQLIVLRKISAPTIVLDDITAKEGETIVLKPTVEYRGDEEVTVSYSLPFDSTGQWTPDFKSAGSYNVTVTARAGTFVTGKNIRVVVQDLNRAPVISGLEEEVSVKEGETVTVAPTITEADEDTVTVSISEPVGSTGVWKTTFDDAGDYTVTVSASDGKETTTQTVRVSVEDVNRAPVIIDITLG